MAIIIILICLLGVAAASFRYWRVRRAKLRARSRSRHFSVNLTNAAAPIVPLEAKPRSPS